MDQTNALPFPSTGPHGHRARMRQKLLQAGPGALADYELLEMLLFLGVERRDTKPMAKAAINRFGGLAETVTAPPERLAYLGRESVVALKLVHEAAARLARAEAVPERPHMDGWGRVQDHLDHQPGAGGFRALLLNNRNRVLADAAIAEDGAEARARAIAAEALRVHATAVILVLPGAKTAAAVLEVAHLLREAAGPLVVQVHDAVVGGPGQWVSLRKAGRLR